MHRHYHIVRKINPRAGAAGLFAAQCAAAYQFPKAAGLPSVRMGIGSLGGLALTSDIQASFSLQGQPPPKVQWLPVGGAAPVSDPQGADVENMLDIVCQGGGWSYSTGTPADIVIGAGRNSGPAIGDVTRALVDAGCEVISWSWGSPLTQWSLQDRQALDAAFQYARDHSVWIVPASGDNSLNDGTSRPVPDCPACHPLAWGVGGSRLVLNADGSIATESAWGDGRSADEGGGGGFDTTQATPAYQLGVIKGAGRGVPDSCANADPASGYRLVCGGGQLVAGGTSGAAPLTAAYFAVLRAILKSKNLTVPATPHALFYARRAVWRDILTGSNGAPAASGWDAATGLGSPNGAKVATVFDGATPTQPPPPTQPLPPVPVAHDFDGVMGVILQEYSQARRWDDVSVLTKIKTEGDRLIATGKA